MALGYTLAHYAFLFQDPVGSDAVAAKCFLRLEKATHSEDARLQVTFQSNFQMGSGVASGVGRRIQPKGLTF